VQIGSLVRDRDHGGGGVSLWRTGLITRVDKDYYGNFNLGKEDRFLVMWGNVTGLDAWEYCKSDDIEVIQ
jgi:hypothetical protein